MSKVKKLFIRTDIAFRDSREKLRTNPYKKDKNISRGFHGYNIKECFRLQNNNCSDPSCHLLRDAIKTPSPILSINVTHDVDVHETQTEKTNDLRGNASASLILVHSNDHLSFSKENKSFQPPENKANKIKTVGQTRFSWFWTIGVLSAMIGGALICLGCLCWIARRACCAGGRDRGSYEVDELSDRVMCRCKHHGIRKHAFHFSAFKSSPNLNISPDSRESSCERSKKKRHNSDQCTSSKHKNKNKEWYV